MAFVIFDDNASMMSSITYRELVAKIRGVADLIHEQFPSDTVIMLSHANEAAFMIGFFGILAAGETVFPVHPKLTANELRESAIQSGASAIIGPSAVRSTLGAQGLAEIDLESMLNQDRAAPDNSSNSIEARASDAGWMLLQSSGTTGRPKIVRRSARSLDAVAQNVADSVGLLPTDRVMGLVPACHSYGVENVVTGPMWAGCCVHLCPILDANVLARHLAEQHITVLPSVPAMFDMLAQVDAPPPMSHLRQVYSAGAILPPSVFDAFLDRYGVRIGQLYGMTEIGSVTFNDANEANHDAGSVGQSMSGVRIRILDLNKPDLSSPMPEHAEGEVAVSAPSMLSGYLEDADDTAMTSTAIQDGFFLTGDLGRIDERGRLTITGRRKLVINVGGMKVSLLEVEDVLNRHKDVYASVVIPIHLSDTIVRLKALILPADQAVPPSAEDLRRHARSFLSGHKVPRMFEFCTDFPRSPTGKILRHRIPQAHDD